MPITDYNTSAPLNLTLGTIPVGPGMEREKVNDALQQLMADIAVIPSTTGSSLIGFLQSGTGAVLRSSQSKMRETISVKDFGAVGDGITDDTAAIHAAFNAAFSGTTDPLNWDGVQFVGWGNTVVYFPQGRYKMTSGYNGYAPIGFKIVGDGKHATSIEYHSDTGDWFQAEIYIAMTIQDISITHVAQNINRATWTCRMLNLDGTGGGRNLAFDRAQIRGFDVQIYFPEQALVDDVNCDTMRASHSDFMWGNTILKGRNAQALINSFDDCTFHGHGDALDVAGFGHTSFNSCSITLDGTTLKLFGKAIDVSNPQLWGTTSIFNFYNTKLEQANAQGYAGGSQTALVKLHGDKALITAQINLFGCGLESDVPFDPAYEQIEITPNMSVNWDGGQFRPSAKIRLTPTDMLYPTRGRHRGLFLKSLESVPLPTQIVRGTATGSQSFPQVVYSKCDGVANLTVGSPGGASGNFTPATMDEAVQTLQLGRDTHYYAILTGGSPFVVHELFHGAVQEIEEIIVDIVEKGTGTLLIETSTDNFTTFLDDYTYPSTTAASNPPGVYLSKVISGATAIGAVVSTGIYVRCSGGAEVRGRVYVRVRAR